MKDPILTTLAIGGDDIDPARRALVAARAAGCDCNPDIRPMTRKEKRAAGYTDDLLHWQVAHDDWCALLQRAQARHRRN